MTEYCRLCAELKDPWEVVASITDIEQSMELKLRACCQWTIENSGRSLPHGVCAICLEKLDKCWVFSQSVQLAEQKLLEIFGELQRCISLESFAASYFLVDIPMKTKMERMQTLRRSHLPRKWYKWNTTG